MNSLLSSPSSTSPLSYLFPHLCFTPLLTPSFSHFSLSLSLSLSVSANNRESCRNTQLQTINTLYIDMTCKQSACTPLSIITSRPQLMLVFYVYAVQISKVTTLSGALHPVEKADNGQSKLINLIRYIVFDVSQMPPLVNNPIIVTCVE